MSPGQSKNQVCDQQEPRTFTRAVHLETCGWETWSHTCGQASQLYFTMKCSIRLHAFVGPEAQQMTWTGASDSYATFSRVASSPTCMVCCISKETRRPNTGSRPSWDDFGHYSGTDYHHISTSPSGKVKSPQKAETRAPDSGHIPSVRAGGRLCAHAFQGSGEDKIRALVARGVGRECVLGVRQKAVAISLLVGASTGHTSTAVMNWPGEQNGRPGGAISPLLSHSRLFAVDA